MKRPQNGNMICSKGPVCSGKEKLIFIDDHSITPGEAHNYLYILFSGARLLGFKSNNCHLLSWVILGKLLNLSVVLFLNL